MRFIKDHKKLFIILGILLVLFIICFVIVYKIFFSYGNNKYGSRLDNIQNLEISNYTVDKLESELAELDGVNSVSYHLNGKLIGIIFKVEPSLEKDDAKEYGDKVLEYFSDEEKEAYDIQIFVTCDSEEDNPYPIIGYKKAKIDHITWSNN
jgi:preprotein translocase subunit SecF